MRVIRRLDLRGAILEFGDFPERVELAARQDDGVPDGVVFIPFAFVEAAANLLTNPALDPFGKIPEFKYCAAKVEPAGASSKVAAE